MKSKGSEGDSTSPELERGKRTEVSVCCNVYFHFTSFLGFIKLSHREQDWQWLVKS
uniref:Uncharacterized protein n=1 Tax=Utricularia reniformis TaxID=192314 RepID=A0A1Y0AYW8_9LAMI|nr:hypothetical protein AEK19_MT1168 [Utricularia reniformis]ART30355.1 hypothetical protein AEK19_MT1168 [Utricularia reniformis]